MRHPFYIQNMAKPFNRLTHKVCVLLDAEARELEHAGSHHTCSSGKHRHYKRNKADELVARGEARWVGNGRNKIQFVEARTWQKVYTRNSVGEVLCCSMQYVPGGAAF